MNTPKKRILVVDDEPRITRLLKLNLEQTNEYEVLVENSATHALRAALAFRPDLILLDILMPDKTGGDLAADFQASPKLKDVPVVFLTAAATKQEVKMRQGMVGGLPFLAKPVDIQEVMACLKTQLRAAAP